MTRSTSRDFTARWQRPLWKALALVALLVTWLPQVAWACPMMGHVGSTPAPCCKGKAMPVAGHCAMPQSSCCKPLQLPASSQPAALPVSTVHTVKFLLSSQRTSETPHEVPVNLPRTPRVVAPSAACVNVQDTSQFSLSSQHGPPPNAGRAPPF